MSQTASTSAPEASQAVVESAVRKLVKRAADSARPGDPPADGQRLLLLRAAPQWRGDATITVDSDSGPVTAEVRGCPTVLAVLDALTEHHDPGAYLVLLTPLRARGPGRLVARPGQRA